MSLAPAEARPARASTPRTARMAGIALVLAAGVSVGTAGLLACVAAAGAGAAGTASLLRARAPVLPVLTLCGVCLGGVVQAATPLTWWTGLLLPAVVMVGDRRQRQVARQWAGRQWAGRGRSLRALPLLVALLSVVVGTLLVHAYFRGHETFVFTAVGLSAPVLPVVALANALVEETVWRAAGLAVARRCGLTVPAAVTVQAMSFGLAHRVGGFPGGWTGVALTGLFGLSQGYLALATRGIALPVAVHAVLDVVIAREVLG